MKRLLPVACVAALVVAPPAAAHDRHGIAVGFVSTVASIDPNILGLSAFVVGGDDRLLLRNLSRRTIVIRGYFREPYLRFTPTAVYENELSPSVLLNLTRYPPAGVRVHRPANARPRWVKVAGNSSYSWHDHRIHWAKRTLPPAVAAAPKKPHKLFDWRVPGTVDAKPFAIVGFLGYVPPPNAAAPPTGDDGSSWPLIAAVFGGALLAVGGLIALRTGRRRR